MMTLFAASSVSSTAAPFLVRATMAAAPTVFVHCFGLLSGFCIFFFRLALPLAPGHVGCARRVIAASSLVGTHCATVQRHAGCTWTCACTFVPAFCRAAVAARCLEDVDFRMACAHVYAHAILHVDLRMACACTCEHNYNCLRWARPCGRPEERLAFVIEAACTVAFAAIEASVG